MNTLFPFFNGFYYLYETNIKMFQLEAGAGFEPAAPCEGSSL